MISCAESMQHELDVDKDLGCCPDNRRERTALHNHAENLGYTLFISPECNPELAGAEEKS